MVLFFIKDIRFCHGLSTSLTKRTAATNYQNVFDQSPPFQGLVGCRTKRSAWGVDEMNSEATEEAIRRIVVLGFLICDTYLLYT